jgi:hypothetical protein
MVQVSKPLVIAGVSAVAAAALLIFALARNGGSSVRFPPPWGIPVSGGGALN